MRRRASTRPRAALALVLALAACSPAATASRGGTADTTPTAAPPPTPSPTAASPSPTLDLPSSGTSESPVPPVAVEPIVAPWTRALDDVVTAPWVSVAVGLGDRILYVHGGRASRIPASAQKLLTSVAALEAFGAGHRFPTVAAARHRIVAGTIRGDLWVIGGGDPELGPDRVASLAAALARRGLRRVTGDVVGDTSAFSRRWWAPGWVEGISRRYVTRPTALAFGGNDGVTPPELEAATTLADALRARGVRIDGGARIGEAPRELREIARVRSATLAELLARQNHGSLNLHAEILARAIGARSGDPTTRGGADQVEATLEDLGLTVRVRDGSGLSHGNAVSAAELVAVLLRARSAPWGRAFVASLPGPGEGTLEGRLAGIPVVAKTGTLFTVPCSALAGYVRDARGRAVAFAVLSEGVPKGTSIGVEDAVARVLASHAIG